METFEKEIQNYEKPLIGNHLPALTLKEIIHSEKYVIFHFLRHLGCIFCKHSADKLYQLKKKNPSFPTIYFIHQSNLEEGNAFFKKHFPNAPHIADPSFSIYKLFGINKLKRISLINPLILLSLIPALLKGYNNRHTGFGDIRLLSGTFLFKDGILVWKHLAKRPGEEPKFSAFK